MRILLFTAALLAATVLAPAQAATLAPFTADYSVRYQGIPASAQATLQRRRENWVYVITVGNVAASMTQATVFRDGGTTLVPLGGSDQARYVGRQTSAITHYDWRNGQVRWSGDAKPSRRGPIPLRSGDVDALLMQLALVRDHNSQRATSYRVMENGRARPMQFRRAGTEQLKVGNRSVATTRYTQTTGDKTTTIWVGAGVPAPVQLTQREGGRETIRLTMTGWRQTR